jgi:hypothetical protein
MSRILFFGAALLLAACKDPVPNAKATATGTRSLDFSEGLAIEDIQPYLDQMRYAYVDQDTFVGLDEDGYPECFPSLDLYFDNFFDGDFFISASYSITVDACADGFDKTQDLFSPGTLLRDEDQPFAFNQGVSGSDFGADGVSTLHTLIIGDRATVGKEFSLFAILDSSGGLVIDQNNKNGVSGRIETSIIAVQSSTSSMQTLEEPIPFVIEFNNTPSIFDHP